MKEYGFYSPSRGYFQVVGGEPKPEDYGPDTIAVPLKPGKDYEWQEGEWVQKPTPPPVPSVNDYERAIQRHIDQTARERKYSDGTSCAGYVSSTVPGWAAEAHAFVAWRDAVWAYAFAELENVQNGLREPPSVVELISELPKIQWP